MLWFHRLQQRLSLTQNEALTLIVLSTLFSAGLVVRHIQQQSNPVAPGAYEEADREFFQRSARMGAFGAADTLDGAKAPDSVGSSRPTYAASKKERGPQDGLIDVNRASLTELQQLPRIGPKTAERIVQFRETYGSFRHVDDLVQVRGIGPKTLEQLRPLIRVDRDSIPR